MFPAGARSPEAPPTKNCRYEYAATLGSKVYPIGAPITPIQSHVWVRSATPTTTTANVRRECLTPEGYGDGDGRGDRPRRNGMSIEGFGIVIVGNANGVGFAGMTPISGDGAGSPSSG